MGNDSVIKRIYRIIFPDYTEEIRKALKGCRSVLDVGCGANSPISRMGGKLFRVGVDLHVDSIEKSRNAGIHDEYYVMDVRDVGKKFSQASFDVVVAIDIIEHLDKKEGWKLIKDMEGIAKKKVIIFTPNGFLPQGEYDKNPWQVHKSGWNPEEMVEAGYRIIGINGWKPLRGEYAEIKLWPKKFWLVFSDITQHITKHMPSRAFQILCIKELG